MPEPTVSELSERIKQLEEENQKLREERDFKFPAMRALLQQKALTPDMAAYLDIIIEDDQSILVAGQAQARSVVLDALKELYRRDGNIYEGSSEHLMYAALGGAPFKPTDVIVANLDIPELAKAQFLLAEGKSVRTLSHMSGNSCKSVVWQLESPPKDIPRSQLQAIECLIIVDKPKNRDLRLDRIIEFVGIEPETNELTTNIVWQYAPNTDNHSYSGHSFAYESIIVARNITADTMRDIHKQRTEHYEKLL